MNWNKQLRTVTKAGLLALLEDYHDDTPIMFPFPAGDYWERTLAGKIVSPTEAFVEWSDYHNDWKVIPDDHLSDNDEEVIEVVLIGNT